MKGLGGLHHGLAEYCQTCIFIAFSALQRGPGHHAPARQILHALSQNDIVITSTHSLACSVFQVIFSSSLDITIPLLIPLRYIEMVTRLLWLGQKQQITPP